MLLLLLDDIKIINFLYDKYFFHYSNIFNNVSLLNGDSIYSLKNPHSYSKLEKKNLRKNMIKLFKGSRGEN
uniref:Uncharacterized protein n=1 Tax=uncultured Prochlorococcus marinus clone HOT0M-5C8 TaxID=379389 RepID=Q1PJE3_PROMR|nr:hypothetical protein HOT0M-5C8_0003 [uncultured Prochlorococcus marinus clone HOT0M-5C8]